MIHWKKVGTGYDIEYVATNDEGTRLGTVAKGGNKWYPWGVYLASGLYPNLAKHLTSRDVSSLRDGKEYVENQARIAGLLNVAV